MGGRGYVDSGSGGFYGGENDITRLEGVARQELQRESIPERRRVFLSFKHEDEETVRMFRGQAKNENSKLDFIDMGLKVPFDSENAEYIRQGIRARIQQSSVTLVVASEKTHESDWVNWEIRESVKLGKGVVVVKTNDSIARMPDAVTEHSDKVKIVAWNHKAIMNAIDEAAK